MVEYRCIQPGALAGCRKRPSAQEDRYWVYLVCLVCLVEEDQLDEQNKPNQPDEPVRPSMGRMELRSFGQ
jgi:hypothetical protein